MSVTELFEGIYVGDVVLMLFKNIYGLNNVAMAFWRDLLREFSLMGCSRINSDPCIYFKWAKMLLLVWLSCIDDCACFIIDDK